MAYARFGAGSDVYLFLDVRGTLTCCGCLLDNKWGYDNVDDFLKHLEDHKAAGHAVPPRAIERILREREEIEQFLRDEKQEP